MNISRVHILTITPELQRYRTVGDWQLSYEGTLTIYVSETGDWRMNMLVAIHELIESVLATNKGISQAEVDKFDFKHQDDEDVSSLPDSPIYAEHMTAYGIEMILAKDLGLDWRKYEAKLDEVNQRAPELKLDDTDCK